MFMKTQRITKSLVITVLLALTAACEFADKTNHDCKAIAKALSQNDKSLLRSEYDELMYESIVKESTIHYRRSYGLMHDYCVKLDQGKSKQDKVAASLLRQ
jgi:hypothetical protein